MNAIGYAILVFVISLIIFGVEIGKDGWIFKFNITSGARLFLSALLALATLLIMWR